MKILKISIWIILSAIASLIMIIFFLLLSGYANVIENEYYQSDGINILYILALPIIPTFIGAKFAKDWGHLELNKKSEYFSIINILVNTIFLIIIQMSPLPPQTLHKTPL
jgi:membrane protease YdiL (CAAX protease family)